jgi:hypothetical protein
MVSNNVTQNKSSRTASRTHTVNFVNCSKLRPQTPKYIRSGWPPYTDTSQPVVGCWANNMINNKNNDDQQIFIISHRENISRSSFAFKSLLVKVIKMAMLHAAQLHLYWKPVFFNIITSPILSLSFAPPQATRKSLKENQLKSLKKQERQILT